ncbi:MAG TPA: sterol desaturase family protein [Burkholderiales bacterium]|jgi:sterol desaturase/sphingolipid hydroxylase (fatty acid hydroxylase superfamily)|nr:sterol desaturase family protein [Burkholderiales bacterium]
MDPVELEVALRGGVFIVAFVALALWERFAPARVLGLSRRQRWGANLGLALVSTLVVRVVLPGSAIALAAIASIEGWGLLHRMELPAWAAVLAAFVVLDLTIYLQHVLFHSVPMLIRLHAVHHADPDFDLTTGIRFHPIEILISAIIKLGAVAALGAPVLAVLIFELLLNAAVMFNHANVSLPRWLEPLVRWILVTPDMHRIHHSVTEAERNSNYGFCLSIWDRWLGTYTPAPRGKLVIGLSDWRDAQNIATLPGTLAMPFRRQA